MRERPSAVTVFTDLDLALHSERLERYVSERFGANAAYCVRKRELDLIVEPHLLSMESVGCATVTQKEFQVREIAHTRAHRLWSWLRCSSCLILGTATRERYAYQECLHFLNAEIELMERWRIFSVIEAACLLPPDAIETIRRVERTEA